MKTVRDSRGWRNALGDFGPSPMVGVAADVRLVYTLGDLERATLPATGPLTAFRTAIGPFVAEASCMRVFGPLGFVVLMISVDQDAVLGNRLATGAAATITGVDCTFPAVVPGEDPIQPSTTIGVGDTRLQGFTGGGTPFGFTIEGPSTYWLPQPWVIAPPTDLHDGLYIASLAQNVVFNVSVVCLQPLVRDGRGS